LHCSELCFALLWATGYSILHLFRSGNVLGLRNDTTTMPPTKDRLKLHKGLRKAESSLLVQMRTGKIGLRAFLFERQVPDIASPICVCGDGRETATHVAAYCLQEGGARRELPFAMQTRRDFDMAV